jgi:surface protein
MGTTSDKLKKLAATKSAIKTAIEGKGIEVADDATFAEYATTLADNVVTPLGQLGYSAEDEAVYADLQFDNSTLRSDLEYSKSLMGKYDNQVQLNSTFANSSIKFAPMIDMRGTKQLLNLFYNCQELVAIPKWDTSTVTNPNVSFRSCFALAAIPLLNLSNCTTTSQLFRDCRSLKTIPQLDLSNTTTCFYLFCNCLKLETLPRLDTSKSESFAYAFYSCTILTTLDIDGTSCTNWANTFWGCNALTNATIRNIGTPETLTTMPLSAITAWGSGSDEARQTLVDSLLTYSFDRAAAGYDTMTIQLASAVKARLTTDEIAAITAKGYTIS